MDSARVFAASLLPIILFSAYAGALESDIFFNGNIEFSLRAAYKAGDSISTEMAVSNLEDFPIAEGQIVIDIVQGCDIPAYPSQLSDCDNIFHEAVIGDLSIPAKSSIRVPFSFKLPPDLKKGKYRMDAYFSTKRTTIVGIGYIHLPGIYKAFDVEGSLDFPQAKILRTQTALKNATGPIGVLVEPSEMVRGEVFVKNEIPNNISNMSLDIKVCSWDDTSCPDPFEQSLEFSLQKNQTKKLDISFPAPEKPDAYAVRLEVRAGERLISLYRSRLIVSGQTAKIRKLYVDRPHYRKGETATITVMLSGSPDHYTKPKVFDVNLGITLKDLNGDSVAFSKAETIPELSSETGLIRKSFSFAAPETLAKFEVCAVAAKGGTVFDEYCYIIDASKFLTGKHKMTLQGQFDTQSMIYSGNLCVFDGSLPAETMARIVIMERENIVKNYLDEIKQCSDLYFSFSPGKEYIVLVNDLDSGEQSRFALKASPSSPEENPQNTVPVAAILSALAILLALFMVISKTRRKEK